ncbi:MAG TPA: hypothetical protein VGF32_03325, partial [Streptosporangiaceae bacterium]
MTQPPYRRIADEIRARIAGLAEDGDGVKVTFASGAVRRFDIVVGADGLHSGVRRLAFGPEQ